MNSQKSVSGTRRGFPMNKLSHFFFTVRVYIKHIYACQVSKKKNTT